MTVRLNQPPGFDFHGIESKISLTDTVTGNDIELPMSDWCFDDDVNNRNWTGLTKDDVCFHEGSELTRYWKIDTEELEPLHLNRTYMMKVPKISFRSWCYAKLSDPDYPWLMRFNQDGAISPEIVEAAPTFASVVEKTIEAARTGAFHRLSA